jgi:hypothetical protein
MLGNACPGNEKPGEGYRGFVLRAISDRKSRRNPDIKLSGPHSF